MKLRTREYHDTDRLHLVRILRLNAPKYFSEGHVLDFEQYLRDGQWDRHYVYLNNDDRVVGCASYWLKSPDTVGLCWMFFEPSQVGRGAIVTEFETYLAVVAGDICPNANPTFVFNTTPRVAKLMLRLGFAVTETVQDGYGKGYDKVCLARKWKKTDLPGDPRLDRLNIMSTVEEIESAVAGLPPEELRRFREWFEQVDADLWDRQFAEDAEGGRLDKAADRALLDFRAGRCTEL